MPAAPGLALQRTSVDVTRTRVCPCESICTRARRATNYVENTLPHVTTLCSLGARSPPLAFRSLASILLRGPCRPRSESHTDTLSAKTGPLAQPRAHKCAHRTARGRAAANAERTRSTFTP